MPMVAQHGKRHLYTCREGAQMLWPGLLFAFKVPLHLHLHPTSSRRIYSMSTTDTQKLHSINNTTLHQHPGAHQVSVRYSAFLFVRPLRLLDPAKMGERAVQEAARAHAVLLPSVQDQGLHLLERGFVLISFGEGGVVDGIAWHERI